LTSSWDSPEPVREWMLANPFFVGPRPGRTMYLGSIEGSPSGALMVLASRGVAGLECVGTIKSAQRRGLGEALVRTALKDAIEEGHKLVVVLSTTEGVPLYKKAGFRAYGTLPEHGMYFDRISKP
jgi:ribosomal protein S18 acetylase RimI-like enzyme